MRQKLSFISIESRKQPSKSRPQIVQYKHVFVCSAIHLSHNRLLKERRSFQHTKQTQCDIVTCDTKHALLIDDTMLMLINSHAAIKFCL